MGSSIGIKLFELHCFRDKNFKRDIKFNDLLKFISKSVPHCILIYHSFENICLESKLIVLEHLKIQNSLMSSKKTIR